MQKIIANVKRLVAPIAQRMYRHSIHAVSIVLLGMSLFGTATSQAQTAVFEQPAPVQLPKDQGAHHSQLEWWYYVGHLYGTDPAGQKREFGFEVTVFQLWPLPLGPATYSWHFALTDVNKKIFRMEERTNSAEIPSQTGGFSFQNSDWSVSGANQSYAIKARLSDNRFAIDLTTSGKAPFVLHGGNGVVDYRPLGNTSAYYSATALDTVGTVYDNGVPIKVTGIAWEDRQWFIKGTVVNGGGTAIGGGWNWFAIQLDNHTQYMLYYLQDPVTGNISNKFGTRVVNGVSSTISGSQMGLDVLSLWLSPKTLYTYPSKWRVTLPEGSLTVTPLVQNQELSWPGHRTYFEGTSQVAGTLNGQAVAGRSYVEVNPWFEPYLSLP